MPKIHQFTKEEYEQVLARMKTIKNASVYRKLEVLRLRMEGYSHDQIATVTAYSKSRVASLICTYKNEGFSGFEEENRKGGNRRNLSFEEEAKFLADFEEEAKKGKIITAKDIQAAYDKKCGHTSSSGTIYKILRRHQWRQILPRPKHPKKSSEEVIATSKKLTLDTQK